MRKALFGVAMGTALAAAAMMMSVSEARACGDKGMTAEAKQAKKKADPLVVDLEKVDYMDSSGVATLCSTFRALAPV